MSIAKKENKPIKSILYVRLPCPKIWPVSVVYLADHIHKNCPDVRQEILDLSLVNPEDESQVLLQRINDFKPEAIAFSWRMLQPFSPDQGDASLANAFQFYFSTNPVTKIKAAMFGAKSVLSHENRVKKTLKLINQANEKYPEAQILVGGPAFSVFWDSIIERCPAGTIGVIGEAENALLKIVRGLPLENERYVWQENGAIKCGTQKEYVDLASQTAVDFSYIESIFPDFNKYKNETISIPTKRGCPFRCLYCIYNYIEGKNVRYRNPAVIGQEVEALNKKYGIRDIWFCDSQFFPEPKNYDICEATLDELIKRKLDINWTGYLRIERINKNIAKKMLLSGIRDFEISMNTGSQKVIDALKLGYKIEQLFDACKMLKEVGFKDRKIHLNLSLNAPGETKETLLETISSVKKIRSILGENDVIPFLFFLAIQPRTGLAKYAIERKQLPEKWDPMSLNPFIIKKLIYNPPPLRKIIGKAVVETLDNKEPLGEGVLKRLGKTLS